MPQPLPLVRLAPGSIATLMGSQFSGKNLSVTFNGIPAQVLFSNATQINLVVPASLGTADIGASGGYGGRHRQRSVHRESRAFCSGHLRERRPQSGLQRE